MTETVGVTEAAPVATLSRRGLYLQSVAGDVTPVFGPPFGEVQLKAAAEMTASRGGARPGARKVADDYLIRCPLPDGAAYLWLIVAARVLEPADIKALAAESLALNLGGGLPAVETSSPENPLMGRVLSALSAVPAARKKKRQRLALEALSAATGWGQPAAISMRRGKAGRVRMADQYGSVKTTSVQIFANTLRGQGKQVMTAPSDQDPSPEAEIYCEEHSIEGFAIALPPEDGIGLYAEGKICAPDIEAARAALALATGQIEAKAKRSARPWVLGALFIAAVIALAMPIDFEIGAPADVEPAQSEIVAIPHEARLTAIVARVGDRVEAGEVLTRFTSPALAEDEKRAALDQMLEALAAQEALAGEDYATYQLADQRRALAEFRAEQSARRLAELTVTAPQAGRIAFIVPSSDIGALIQAGTPVAEIQFGGDMRAKLKIAITDGPLVKAGMTGQIVVRGVADETYGLTVLEDPIMTTTQEGEQTLSVIADIHAPEGHRLLKGLSGYARLSAGTRPRAVVWARPVTDFLRLSAWKYLGLRL